MQQPLFRLIVIIMLAAYGESYLLSSQEYSSTKNTFSSITRSSSTGLNNECYNWRGQQIRYLVTGPIDAKKSVLLIHGLFVNADHWRRLLPALGKAGYRTYALDLLGSGYSSKPVASSFEAKLLNGENGRFDLMPKEGTFYGKEQTANNLLSRTRKKTQPSIRENVILGTSSGGRRTVNQVDLRHPLNSCYNFYTWAEQVTDFTEDVIFQGVHTWIDGSPKTTSLVGNSKGTIVALQAVLDKSEYFNGVFAIDPTYRELHNAEMHFPHLTKPPIALLQWYLRNRGYSLYTFATQQKFIKLLLEEPYYNHSAIDNELVTSLSIPLNLPGAADVVFDELSYSTGPLFEQLLQDVKGELSTSESIPIWICYGKKDPWLSPKRVDSLLTTPLGKINAPIVDKVFAIEDAGHCPHDENPNTVNPIILEFLQKCQLNEKRPCKI